MRKKEKSHVIYYIFLIFIFVFVFLLTLLSSSKQLQVLIIVMGILFYVGFGILHHLINHDLTAKIVIEYVLIGSIGLSVMFFLVKGGLGI